MKLTPREKNYIMLAFTVAFCSIVFSYLIVPQRDRYNAAKDSLAQAESQFSRLKLLESSAEDSDSQIKKMTVQMSVYSKMLPVRPETAELLYYLNKAALTTGVVFERYEKPQLGSGDNQTEANLRDNSGKPTGAAKGDAVRTLPIRIRVTGSFNQIRAFLGETEHLPRLTHNRSLVINDLPEQKRLECIIEFDAFYKPSEIPVPENNDVPKAATGKQTLFEY